MKKKIIIPIIAMLAVILGASAAFSVPRVFPGGGGTFDAAKVRVTNDYGTPGSEAVTTSFKGATAFDGFSWASCPSNTYIHISAQFDVQRINGGTNPSAVFIGTFEVNGVAQTAPNAIFQSSTTGDRATVGFEFVYWCDANGAGGDPLTLDVVYKATHNNAFIFRGDNSSITYVEYSQAS